MSETSGHYFRARYCDGGRGVLRVLANPKPRIYSRFLFFLGRFLSYLTHQKRAWLADSFFQSVTQRQKTILLTVFILGSIVPRNAGVWFASTFTESGTETAAFLCR